MVDKFDCAFYRFGTCLATVGLVGLLIQICLLVTEKKGPHEDSHSMTALRRSKRKWFTWSTHRKQCQEQPGLH